MTDALPADLPRFDARVRLYLWLTGAFVTCLLLANIVGVKLFLIEFSLFGTPWSVNHTAGMIAFPVTFLLTDLLNEYYGKKAARRVTWIAFTMGFVALGLIWVARILPIDETKPGTATHASFENVFGAATLMYVASMVAFLMGSMLDIFIFGFFKRVTKGKMVWLRATGSTLISQVFDSFVITFVFFDVMQRLTGQEAWPFGDIISTAATGYVLKFVLAVVLTPLIYLGRWMIRRFVGLTPVAAESA
jgi:uncharacterized integral membrane protein (TIGR00697 family)